MVERYRNLYIVGMCFYVFLLGRIIVLWQRYKYVYECKGDDTNGKCRERVFQKLIHGLKLEVYEFSVVAAEEDDGYECQGVEEIA